MSETPRDQRGLWSEVNARFEELGEALRVHLSPDAARTPSDPGGSEAAPWADPADLGDSPPASAASGATPPADAVRRVEAERAADAWAAATADDSAAAAPQPTAPDLTAPDLTAPHPAAPHPADEAPVPAAEAPTTEAPTADARSEWVGPTAAGGPAGDAGSGPGDAEERPWSKWTGSGRFAGGADWETARHSVRNLGESVQRAATQAGDAARDPEVRESAQRAARSLGDAIATTAQDIATEVRERMRSPRWSDPDTPGERPPVAPVDDDPPPPTP